MQMNEDFTTIDAIYMCVIVYMAMGTQLCFSTIFTKEHNFHDFLFAPFGN